MSNFQFDPSKFTAPKAKPLPVVMLLDVSGSMGGEKILNLNAAVRDMLEEFGDTATSEVELHVAIITFGAEVRLHQPLANASAIKWQDLGASGMTPLGTALQMAKAMIEDKDIVPSRAYRPAVILVSDGAPNDEWDLPLSQFIGDGRSAKCDRFAMAIGADANEAVLGKFLADSAHPLLYAENARQLRECFQYITMSVTTRTRSQTPNSVPPPDAISIQPNTIEARRRSAQAVKPPASQDGGYW